MPLSRGLQHTHEYRDPQKHTRTSNGSTTIASPAPKTKKRTTRAFRCTVELGAVAVKVARAEAERLDEGERQTPKTTPSHPSIIVQALRLFPRKK